MDEDGSDRHSAVGQDLQRTIVDHGARSIGDRLHTAHCGVRAQDKHSMRAQQRALGRFAAHCDNVADAYVKVVVFIGTIVALGFMANCVVSNVS